MTAKERLYGLNETRHPVSIFPGDRFDTPRYGMLTVSLDGETGALTMHDQAGAAVDVVWSIFEYRAHFRANGSIAWPKDGEA